MPGSEFHLCMRSLLELAQTGTVAEYTTLFWEHLHQVLHLDSSLSIKCFVHHYIKGLHKDIQAVVQSQSPSSITRASCLARIREEEIMKDEAMGAEECGDGCNHEVQDRCVDGSRLAAPIPTRCSTECPSRGATVNIFPELASLAVRDEALDIDTVHVAAPTPAICSTGDLAHGSDDENPVTFPMMRLLSVLEHGPLTFTAVWVSSNGNEVTAHQFMTDVTPGWKPQGKVVRPAPWPSFLDEGTSIDRGDIVEPPLSVAMVSTRTVAPHVTWQEIMLEDNDHNKEYQGDLVFGPQPEFRIIIPQPLDQPGEINNRHNVADDAGTKSNVQCNFIRLPTEDSLFTNREVPDASRPFRVQSNGYPHSYSDGSTSRNLPQSIHQGNQLPFISSSNPVMSLVAFLASAIGPRISASCTREAYSGTEELDYPTIGITRTRCSSCALFAGPRERKLRWLFSAIILEVTSEKHEGIGCFLQTSDSEKKINSIHAAGEQAKRLCYVGLRPWPYSVLHFIEPCSSGLGMQRYGRNGRLSPEVACSTTNIVLLPRDTTQLPSWPLTPYGTEDFNIHQDGTQGVGDCHMYKEKQPCMAGALFVAVVSADFHGLLILTKNILGWSLHLLECVKKLDTARETSCGATELDLPHIHNCMGIIVDLKPWPSWKISGHDNVILFWWFLHNAFSAIFSTTIDNLMDWWSAIPFVQPAHTIGDATLHLGSAEQWATRMPNHVLLTCSCGLDQLIVHAFDPKPICQTKCTALLSWWLTTQEMYYLCHTAVLSFEIWCLQPDGKISSGGEANTYVSLNWLKLVAEELQFSTQGYYLLGSEFFTAYLELPFDPGDHWLLRLLLTISGVSVGYIQRHEHRGASPYHLPWCCTTLQLMMEVGQVENGCFILGVWLLGIIGEFALGIMWPLLEENMARRDTTDNKVNRVVGYHILSGTNIPSEGTIFHSQQLLYLLVKPSPRLKDLLLHYWNTFEINSNHVIPAVSVEHKHAHGRLIQVIITLLLPRLIVVRGGLMLHAQSLHGHLDRLGYLGSNSTTFQDFGKQIPVSKLVWSSARVSVHASELFVKISTLILSNIDLKYKEDNQSFPSDLAVISTQLKCDDANISWSSWHHMFWVDWPNPFLQHVVKLVGVSEQQPPWDPGGVRLVDIICVLNKLQVPWDPGGSHHRLEDKPHFKGARMSCPRGHALYSRGPSLGNGPVAWAGPNCKDLEHCL